MNELHLQTSPYLLQHAQNPVHWKAWNDAALGSAQVQNKLLIVSVGYSACHWCHVMEHETFENEQAAAVMNAHFISVKVDREERPDLDAVYMKAVQIMTGRGGWPLNVVCLPDGRPVWGGTYFRTSEWTDTLEQLHDLWQTNPDKMTEYAQKLHDGLQAISVIDRKATPDLPQDWIAPLVEKWKKSFDREFGGMARAPKFMMPNNYDFLMHYGHRTNDTELLGLVDLTLTRMAWGGLFDTVGGGFSRYSVDMKWHVPHFEKMLYDNGQLVSVYADAFKRTQNPLYRQVIDKTLSFVLRELTTDQGAFYSALDADSLDTHGDLEEGAFYVWTQTELESLLGDDFALFKSVFNLDAFGHWENGNFVLIQNQTIENLASQHGLSISDLASRKQLWEQMLYAARENRPKPRLDDKCLTSWNAMMCKGFADAYQALGNEQYRSAALQNGDFLAQRQWHPDGHLWHSYKNGLSTINGYLEDYAHTASAFIALYRITFDERWLTMARQLTDYCFAHFYDDASGFFRFTSDTDPALIAPHFETEDNVIPASNSVLAHVLLDLAVYLDNAHYEKTAANMLAHIAADIDYPSAFSNWMSLALRLADPKELVICGEHASNWARQANALYLPGILLAAAHQPASLPLLQNRHPERGTLAYACQNKACGLPSTDLQNAISELNR